MLLFYIIQRITFRKFCIFWKCIVAHHSTALLQVVQCRSHLKSLFVRNVGIINCSKLKITMLRYSQRNKFRANPTSGFRIKSCGQTDRYGQSYTLSFHTHVQGTHKEFHNLPKKKQFKASKPDSPLHNHGHKYNAKNSFGSNILNNCSD
jgi:hypothetical protein